ncbi:MAG: single-stranded DNA-binding protein [Bacillota bacterium]
MLANVADNNTVTLIGKVNDSPIFSHEVFGEGFYTFNLSVLRLSDTFDNIPILISDRLLDPSKIELGIQLKIEGQFRSYNSKDSSDHKLLLSVFAREVEILGETEDNRNPNQIELNGFICKKPVFRTTPSGREISDILLAVNRSYNKSDYLPCISWGRNARYTQSLKVGDNIKVWGRIQSRTYQKHLENGEISTKIAYEISVSKLALIEIENT